MTSWECHRCGVVNAPTRSQCTCRPHTVLVAGELEAQPREVPATVVGPPGDLPSESWVEVMPTFIKGADER